MKKYKKIFITNLPSFYKVNLLNKINEKEKIFVIFTGNTASIRNSDFFKLKLIEFDYKDLKELSSSKSYFFVLKIILFTKYDELIIGGWDESILWITNFFGKRNKKSLIVESSIYDSEITGLKAFAKKVFLKGISKVYASGKSQVALLRALSYSGIILKTKGVGLFNIQPQPIFVKRENILNFLYVGRLSPEKNLIKLIEVFNKHSYLFLNIVGFGPDEENLKKIANGNIIFHGPIDNVKLFKYYQKFDVFILPSVKEPWGLVVEEALNNGMPVIVSNRVGCSDEIVKVNNNGLIFNSEDLSSLEESILKMTDPSFYNSLRRNISEMNFKIIAEDQVNVYLS